MLNFARKLHIYVYKHVVFYLHLQKAFAMKRILINKKWQIIGVLVGLIVGYLYYRLVGCSNDTCKITSSPINISLYGGLLGYLLMDLFSDLLLRLRSKK